MKSKIFRLLIVTFLITFSKSDKIFAQMFWNQACSFSGNPSNYISVRPSSTLNIISSFTIEAWLKISNLTGNKGIVSKGGSYGSLMKYALRVRGGGRIEIRTEGELRLISKSALTLNQWTHIAVVYDNSLDKFTIYINGQTDTSVVIPNAQPGSNSDSLFIGLSGQSSPYAGIMDELRIWNRALGFEIVANRRLTLGTSSGNHYNGLILSMTFQKEASGGEKFTCNDWSNHQNYGRNYGVTPVDLSDQTSETIGINQSVRTGSGPGDIYLAGADDPDISPTKAITLQAWIWPSASVDGVIIHKGSPTGGAGTNYSISIDNRRLVAVINGITFDSQDTIPFGQWSHVAFVYSYNSSTFLGSYGFLVDGKPVNAGPAFGVGNIVDGSDSLYIGGTNGLPDFWGYIDEVRISSHAKSEGEINDSLYVSMENASNIPGVTIAYNFDGYTYCSSLRGPLLHFRNNIYFTSLNPLNNGPSYPVSPLNKGALLTSFQKGYYMKNTKRWIAASGDTGGMTEDSLEIFSDENLTDVNFFVAFNHKNIQDLELYLQSPGGIILQVLNSNTLLQNADNVITVFDDQSANNLVNGLYASYSPSIKPLNYLNTFNGVSSKGTWKILINAGSETGRLYSWGIQINNKTILPKVIRCNAILQGFYNAYTNNMIRDTIKSYLRNSFSPFTLIDSSKIYFQGDGSGAFSFNSISVLKGTKYYLQIKHRNSIETWSNTTGVVFEPLTSQATYDFTTDSAKAYGSNLIRVDGSPIKFAIYSGDVNQDGTVDATDLSLIDNAAFNFANGYVIADLTGDNFVDAADAALGDNNAFNFVSKITP